MKTNFNPAAWLQKLALSVGLTVVLCSITAPVFAQGNPGQPQYGNPSQYGGPQQFGMQQPQQGQGQFGPQQQFNRPQQAGQPQQFSGQGPRNRQQFNGPQQFAGQGQSPQLRGPAGSMQGGNSMPRMSGGSQRGQAVRFNRPQGMGPQNAMNVSPMYGNQMGGNPGMNRNGMARNGSMQGMNRSPGGNPGFMGNGGPNAGSQMNASPMYGNQMGGDLGMNGYASRGPQGMNGGQGNIVVEITDENFQSEVLDSTTPVLVDLWAPWCGPCRKLSPLIEQIAQENFGSFKVVKLNVDDSPAVSKAYNVQGLPTLLIFRDGNLVDSKLGAPEKDQLQAALDAAKP